ncbi:SCO1431 family membrane protein [Streptomyces sp. RerS4]|uniref:SCO1431 family membrane protein n=1 Tax=Streptomyces sp. RerS4 TaxID=2942449 RepID=UPI00201BD389|nr:SCO1431 family membrane protein [Streptomyces sp. RerS4]UQX00193.1 SCO1431 family membrane protein [Streptomyces sp. RerS4]
MTAHTAALTTRARARRLVGTGGPEEGSSWVEHVLGWTLVVVVAMLVTQLGWI